MIAGMIGMSHDSEEVEEVSGLLGRELKLEERVELLRLGGELELIRLLVLEKEASLLDDEEDKVVIKKVVVVVVVGKGSEGDEGRETELELELEGMTEELLEVVVVSG